MSFKILLIEADPDWVDRVQRPLSEAGYDVIVADGGDAGVAAVERDRPDLTLIRSILPDGDGLGYCRAIKSSPGGRDKPLVLLSDAADRDPAEAACDACLAVPVAERALLELCGQLLDGEVDAALNEPESDEHQEDKLLESIEELGREELLLTLPDSTADSPAETDLEPPDEEAAEQVLEEIGGIIDPQSNEDIAAHLEAVFTIRGSGALGDRRPKTEPETKPEPDAPAMLGLEGEVIVAPSHVPELQPVSTPPASSYGVDPTRAAFQTQAVFGVDSPPDSPAEVAGGSARRLALFSAVIVVVITAVLIFVLPQLSPSRSRPQDAPASAIPGGGSVGVKAGSTGTASGWPEETSPVLGEPDPKQREGGRPAQARTEIADEVAAVKPAAVVESEPAAGKPSPLRKVADQGSPSAQEPVPPKAATVQSSATPPAPAPALPAESERPAAAEVQGAKEPSPGPTETDPAEGLRGFEPPRVLRRAEPKYSVFDVEQAGSDTVMLRVLIDEGGQPVRVVVERGTPGSPLVSSAIDAVLHSRYEPATEDGAPVRAWKTEKFVFE